MKKIIFTLLMSTVAMGSFAQLSTEVGYNIGFSSYLGDLQPKAFTYDQPGFSTGFHIRHNITSQLAVRGMVNYGRLNASDAKSLDQGHIQRNLSFRTYIMVFGGVMEVNVLPFDTFNTKNKKYRRYFNFTPFFFGGVNVFHFNPKTLYKNEWVALQPLQTEGQNYSLTQIAIPFGFGFKHQVSKHIGFQIEFGFRKTFTDYIDDVSTNYPDLNKMALNNPTAADLSFRGDELPENPQTIPTAGSQRGLSSNMDWYLINNVSFTYKIFQNKKY